MTRRLLNILAIVLLLITASLVIWQGSFKTGDFGPADPEQTFLFFGVSTIIFLVMLALAFMVARLGLKIWMERRGNRVGSRIRTKLVVGALTLSILPVIFMVLESYYVLNNTMERWFNRPIEHELVDFVKLSNALKQEVREKAAVQAQLLATIPATAQFLSGQSDDSGFLNQFCASHGLLAGIILRADNNTPVARWGATPSRPASPPAPDKPRTDFETARAPVYFQGGQIGAVVLTVPVPINISRQQQDIESYDRAFSQLRAGRKKIRGASLQLLTLIALFILFVSSWLAQYFARQLSTPISALLQGAEEVSKGNLQYRVTVHAADELGQLVDGFNRMTGDLEANRAEIESRRRFTEAILESIPTGVLSVDSAGRIQLANEALGKIFPSANARAAKMLEDLFAPEDVDEIHYLMNRARRTGLAVQHFEIKTPQKTMHLAITVSALEGRRSSGFVVVIEDTSDLLRAQKASAWSEVARRVAHEIKNPLTPIMLSAERIARKVKRAGVSQELPPDLERIVNECTDTILNETASVKRLVDEFAQFSRLPAAKPVETDLNDVVRNGLAVFEGRLEGIAVTVDLAPHLPPVLIDPEQFKRIVVNLVDNAAEAMQGVGRKSLTVATRLNEADSVELIFADSGCGITPDQREKLFLPYFSTKSRGTGLGLAIVSHILAEHNASIRVEDNKPSGAVFSIELPVLHTATAADSEPASVSA